MCNEMSKLANSEFLVGDIVEILNITSSQKWDLGESDAERVIGMRFKIIRVAEWNDDAIRYYISTETTRGITGDGKIEPCFEANQLMLYKRPKINWCIKIIQYLLCQ